MRIGTRECNEVWVVDFEYGAQPGERPVPICMVAHELVSGQNLRLWQDDLERRRAPPFPVDVGSLFVAYYASAEVGCHLALGWPVPAAILDLFVEFRNATNGRDLPCGAGLLGAMTWYGLDAMSAVEKDDMRQLALRGGPWTSAERLALLDYCEEDVNATARLLERMASHIDIERALLRGRFMAAAAQIEATGVPIDTAALAALRASWSGTQGRLIERIDRDFGVYKGRTFKSERWERWLNTRGIPWPRTETGKIALDQDTFKEMTRAHPEIALLGELRSSLANMRLEDLTVGRDGRNRCLLSAFRAKTGRNQPSNTKFIFGPAVWLRSVIKPEPGRGLAYVDYAQQEFGIAAALSHDPAMMDAYVSGDPYLTFAKQAGAAPPCATKATHGAVRERFKSCVLAVQYGLGALSLAGRTGLSLAEAQELLRLHHLTYPVFWAWSDRGVDHALLRGTIRTALGWTLHVGRASNVRSLRNFPMQANGAEILRLACIFVTEAGIRVCAPVHDALLVEDDLSTLDETVAKTQAFMGDASEVVLGGFRLRSEAMVVRNPERYMDKRGEKMWATVWEAIGELRAEAGTCALVQRYPCTSAHPSDLISLDQNEGA